MNTPPIPKRPLRFSRNDRKLLRHVYDHVVCNRNEAWHQILPSDAVAQARDNASQTGSLGTAGIVLCCAYLRYTEDLIADNAIAQQAIAYVFTATGDQDHANPAAAWGCMAWNWTDRSLAGAIATVRQNGHVVGYRLATCFRIDPRARMGRKDLARKYAERIMARERQGWKPIEVLDADVQSALDELA